MASVTRTVLGAIAVLPLVACYSPRETQGATEALAIYRRSVRREDGLIFRTPSSTEDAHAGASTGAPVTIDVAIRLAKRNSARLAELSARVAAADAGIEAAGQRHNPDLRVTNVRAGHALDTGQPLSASPRLRFSPERPGEIGAREAEARAAKNEVRAEARAEETAIEVEIRWLFDDILLLEAEIAAADRVATTRRRLAAQAREQLATSTMTAVDATLANLYAIEADVHVADRRSRRELVLATLLDRIGVSGVKIQLAGDPMAWPPSPLPTEQELIEAALQRSPQVSVAAARIDGASARLHLEETRRWPWFRFVDVGYELAPSHAQVPWTVGAGVELPLFTTNGGAIRQAEASKSAAKQHVEAEVERIVRDVRARLREAQTAAALVSEFREAALAALEQANTETTRALDSSSIDLIRVLKVDERRSLVELELFKRIRQYHTAMDALRRAVGGPLPSSSTK